MDMTMINQALAVLAVVGAIAVVRVKPHGSKGNKALLRQLDELAGAR
tara:strand:- start:6388 stop:6528 length:141 start_codon:yes stop_codon:yes gene_type:complete